ncbi:hypothetical protein KQX64_23200 [Rhodopseudomonas palustris]|nr:hypothetical protein KQX64_23200 [Rhodopseudomonas palustris]
MFNKPTVIVIGAGASFEYGFPLGATLKDQVAKAARFRFEYGHHLTMGSEELLNHIRRHVSGDISRQNIYTRAGSMLAQAIPSFISIDEALHFVSSSREAVEIGKIAIIENILNAERNSNLRFDLRTGRPSLPDDGWLSELFSMAVAGLRRENLADAFKNITFINFNYDRAIEQYLYFALQERTSADAELAETIVGELNMLRPYGSIGSFSPIMNHPESFGTTAHFDPFQRLSNLATYTEKKPLHDAAAMRNALQGAHLVLYLGFGYHASNLGVVANSEASKATSVLGTVKGINSLNHAMITGNIIANIKTMRNKVELLDMTAAEMLKDLRPRILMTVS